MTALFKISNKYLQLADKLAEGDFDVATIADTIEASGLVDDFTDKAQALEFVARGATAHHAAIDAEIDRLIALKQKREAVAAGVRKYLLTEMQRTGISKITCPLFSIGIANNPPSTEIYDSLSLPSVYMRLPEPKPPVAFPDKAAIKAVLLAGVEVPGARLVHSQRLTVK
jgi:Siphovirus Gp157